MNSRWALVIEGSISELFELPNPSRATGEVGIDVTGYLLGRGPANHLIRSVLQDDVRRWLSWPELKQSLAGGSLTGLIVSGEAWRRHGARLWSHLPRGNIYVAHRPRGIYTEVMLAAESVATARALLARFTQPPEKAGAALRLVHAVQPSTWQLLAAAGAWGGRWLFEDGFPDHLDTGGRGAGPVQAAILAGPPTTVVRQAVLEAQPDLLVLGWHRHLTRHPLIAHPIAWRLSRSLPTDVLIVDVEAAPATVGR